MAATARLTDVNGNVMRDDGGQWVTSASQLMSVREHEIQLAEHMCANWLMKLRRLQTGALLSHGLDTTWLDMSEIEKHHYIGLLHRAMDVIWPEGR